MKFNGISVILLMVIYFFAINVPIKVALSQNEKADLNNQGAHAYSQSPLQLNLYTSDSFSLAEPVINAVDFRGEDLFKNLFGLDWKAEFNFSSVLHEHYKALKNFQVPFRKHDIIFPFHYFW